MSLEEAGVALGNDVFKVREEAEQVIRMAGIDEYDRVGRFARSDDPEVATRARRCLPILLLAIDDRFPPDLAAKLRRIDDFRGQELEQIVAAIGSLDPPRTVTLIGLHSHWQAEPPDSIETTQELVASLEPALETAFRSDGILPDLDRIRPERYEPGTLATVLNGLCKLRQDDLAPLLPVYQCWTRSHPRLPELLNGDGYRLEVARETSGAPDRIEALRKLLALATNREMSPDQLAALRRTLADYRDDATAFPVRTLDERRGWFFFDIFGPDHGGQAHLDSYREFRQRFPAASEWNLLSQPLEVLLVLEKSGPAAAMDHAMKQRVHGGVVVLGEWLHAHPQLIREPLPLPPVKDGASYPYRTVKFFRTFAPYAEEHEMKNNPEIMAAFKILARDPGWNEVAKQARAVMAAQQAEPPR